jgi:hypothetical protein
MADLDEGALVAAVLAAKCLQYCAQPGVYPAWAAWTTGSKDPAKGEPPPPELMLAEAHRLMIGVAEAMGMLRSGGGDGTLN